MSTAEAGGGLTVRLMEAGIPRGGRGLTVGRRKRVNSGRRKRVN